MKKCTGEVGDIDDIAKNVKIAMQKIIAKNVLSRFARTINLIKKSLNSCVCEIFVVTSDIRLATQFPRNYGRTLQPIRKFISDNF